MGSPELCASFPESFSATPSSQVHFNIAPQRKTIKDRIRQAYYSANNKKREGSYFLQKFLCRRNKKSKIDGRNFTACLCSVFCVFLASSPRLLSPRCGFSDRKVMLTVAFFFFLFFSHVHIL